MKKILSILFVLTSAFFIFAEETETSAQGQNQNEEQTIERSETYISIQNLIDENLDGNLSQISALSEKLAEEEKDALYEENSVPYWPIALNAIGFGIGSYIQGNTKDAVRATICDAIGGTGLILSVYGMVVFGGAGIVEAILMGMGGQEPNSDLLVKAALCYGGMIVSGSLLTVSNIISIVSSCVYPSVQNKKLSEAIYPTKTDAPEFTLLPIFTPSEKSGIAPGFVCMMKF